MEVIPFDAALGAEVRGLDLSSPLDARTVQQLRDAWHQHALLLFRGQSLTPAEQVRFSRGFGELEIHVLDQWRQPEHPEILIVSNLKDGDRHVGVYNAGRYWHTDLSYMAEPSKGSILYAIEVPAVDGRPLGDTLFASTGAAFDSLSTDERERLRGLRATFSLSHQRQKLEDDGDVATLTDEQRDQTPVVTHAVVQRHPVTGREVLFVNEGHTIGICDLPESESRALLGSLYAVITSERHVYRHRWQPGDVLMWDNIATQHLASFDYALPQRRYMHRTTLRGSTLK